MGGRRGFSKHGEMDAAEAAEMAEPGEDAQASYLIYGVPTRGPFALRKASHLFNSVYKKMHVFTHLRWMYSTHTEEDDRS